VYHSTQVPSGRRLPPPAPANTFDLQKFLDNAALLGVVLHEQASTRLVEHDCSIVNIAGKAGRAMLSRLCNFNE
jgi:hypothetical protein